MTAVFRKLAASPLCALAGGMAMLASAHAAAGSATYTYDNLGRVTRIAYSNGVVITYTYDAAGNRTAVVTTGAPS